MSTAIGHYQQAIRHFETRGDTYWAGAARFDIALLLGNHGRARDALHYARAALTNYQQIGPGAAADTARTEQLIQRLEQGAAAAPS